jgi:hypothetical protein
MEKSVALPNYMITHGLTTIEEPDIMVLSMLQDNTHITCDTFSPEQSNLRLMEPLNITSSLQKI